MPDRVKEKLVDLIWDSGMVENKNRCQILAEELIANGVTVQQWLPASEPPKDDTTDYWVIYKGGDKYFYTTGYFDGKCWRSSASEFKLPVIGYMPLPEPPNE